MRRARVSYLHTQWKKRTRCAPVRVCLTFQSCLIYDPSERILSAVLDGEN